MKIPYFGRLDRAYSSLLGIPMSKIPGIGNIAFVSTTTYLELDCYSITQGLPVPLGVSENGVIWPGTKTELNGTFFIAVNGYIANSTFLASNSIAAFMNATNSSSIPHTLLFQSTNFDTSGIGSDT